MGIVSCSNFPSNNVLFLQILAVLSADIHSPSVPFWMALAAESSVMEITLPGRARVQVISEVGSGVLAVPVHMTQPCRPFSLGAPCGVSRANAGPVWTPSTSICPTSLSPLLPFSWC